MRNGRVLRVSSVQALAESRALVQRQRASSAPTAATLALLTAVAAGNRPREKKKRNKTETAYDNQVLRLRKFAGEILWYDFEAITLKLADDTRYTPDYPVVLADGSLEFHEVKGFMRDDAWVKLKLAAKLFPFKFILVRARSRNLADGFTFQDV